MESIEVITKSGKETKKLGGKLAKEIAISHMPYATGRKAYGLRRALVLSLEGELGAGKTTFTQGFAKGLGVKENPRSPTFVIMRVYEITPLNPPYFKGEKRNRFSNFIHIDAYRISTKDLKVLGWDEFSKNPKNIILIEWGNILKKAMPKKTIRIIFKHAGHSQHRLITIIQ